MKSDKDPKLADLEGDLETGRINRIAFIKSALKLGVSTAAIYAALDRLHPASAAARDAAEQQADDLRRALGDRAQQRIVDITADRADDRDDVKERIARLRERVRRAAAESGSERKSGPLGWVDWDNEWPKWGDFNNWHNWNNNWGNWNNWGNTWSNTV